MTHIKRIDEWSSGREGFGGWRQDPDEWTMIGTPDDGELYKTSFWWGNGYTLDCYLVWAEDEYDALEKAARYLELSGDKDYEECQELASRDNSEDSETFLSLGNGYVWSENLGVEKAPDEYADYVRNGGRDNGECRNVVIDERRGAVVEAEPMNRNK